jgi:hypothetical protein
MRRRELITLAGGAAIGWPLVARAQQTIPVIGVLDSRMPEAFPMGHRDLRQGLKSDPGLGWQRTECILKRHESSTLQSFGRLRCTQQIRPT